MPVSPTRTHFGDHFSEGARQLWLALPKLEKRWGLVGASSVREELQRQIGASRGTLSKYLYGDRRPNLSHAVALHTLAGIAPRLWDEKPAKEFTLPAVEAATGT